MFLSHRRTVPLVIFSVAAVLLSLTPLRELVLFLFAVSGALYIPLLHTRKISLLLRFILITILLFCFIQTVGMLLWLIKAPFSYPLLTACGLIVLVPFMYKMPHAAARPFIERSDIVSLLTAAGGVILLVTFTFAGSIDRTTDLLRVSTTSSDDVNHLSMVLTDYENRGYVYGPAGNVLEDMKYSNMVSYPQGWHLVNAVLMDGIPHSGTAATKLTLFYMFRLLWYGLIVYMFCRASFFIFEVLQKKKPSIDALVLGIFGGSMFQLLVGSYFLKAGFSSFLAQLLFSITFIFITLHYFDLKRRSVQQTITFLIASCLLVAGMAFSWLLAFPIGALTLVIALLSPLHGRQILLKSFVKKDYIAALLICLLILSSAMTVVLVQIIYPTSSNLINLPGSIVPIQPLLLFSLLGITLFFGIRDRVVAHFQLIMALLMPCLIFIGGLYTYQFWHMGKTSYYPIKLQYVLLTLLMIFCTYLLMKGSSWLTKTYGRTIGVLAPISIGMFALFTPLTALPQSYYAAGERLLSESSATKIARILEPATSNKDTILLLGQENYVEDFIATHLMHALTRQPESECSKQMLTLMEKLSYDDLYAHISYCAATGVKYKIVTSNKSGSAVRENLTIPGVEIY